MGRNLYAVAPGPGHKGFAHRVWLERADGSSHSKEEMAIAGGPWNLPQIFNQHTGGLIGQRQLESITGFSLRDPNQPGPPQNIIERESNDLT